MSMRNLSSDAEIFLYIIFCMSILYLLFYGVFLTIVNDGGMIRMEDFILLYIIMSEKIDYSPIERNKEKKYIAQKDKIFVEKGKEIGEVTESIKTELGDFSKEQLNSVLPLIDDDNILNTFE